MIYPETSRIARAQHKFIAFQMAKKYFVSIGIDGFVFGYLAGSSSSAQLNCFAFLYFVFHLPFSVNFVCVFFFHLFCSFFMCLSFDSYISVFQLILYICITIIIVSAFLFGHKKLLLST